VNRALWLLVGLQCRGWLRTVVRGTRTVRGALLALVGLGFVGLWLWAASIGRQQPIDPDELRLHGPAIFLGYCLLTVLLSRGERAIYFSPAEVEFLFAGPFTRRQLLGYKITVSALICMLTSLVLMILLRVHARWLLAGWFGLFLGFVFLQLFSMVISLIGIMVGVQAYTRGRRVALLLLGVVAAVLIFRSSQEAGGGGFAGLFRQLEHYPAWRVLTAPLGWYIETFLVQPGDWLALLQWGGLSVGFTAVMIAVVLLLDAQYLETVAATSERVYTQIQKMRRGEAMTFHLGEGGKARWGLPSLPWWGGIGPIAWRQMTTAIRGLGRLALMIFIMLPMLFAPLFGGDRERSAEAGIAIIAPALITMSMLLSTMVPFDFRGDLDRMEVLKTLPVPAWRLVIGQLVAPVFLLGALQSLCLIVFWVTMGLESWLVPWGVAFVVPVNFLLLGLDNLLFLWFPSRILATRPADFQAIGRNVVTILVKLVVLMGAVAAAAGLGILVGSLASSYRPLVLLTAWTTLSLFAAVLVPLSAMAFRSFDVSRDMPA
jgi:hypothetical protein